MHDMLSVRIGLPFSLFLQFLSRALEKAINGKELVLCAKLNIDHEKRSYLITSFIDPVVVSDSAVHVDYFCHEKEVVIHTHVNLPPHPSGTDIRNMEKDNTTTQRVMQIGKIIRPHNPVYYIISSIYFDRSEVRCKVAGYAPRYHLKGVRIEEIRADVEVANETYKRLLVEAKKINYGVVYYTYNEGKIIIKNVADLEEHNLGRHSSDDATIGFFVTGLTDTLSEPQDYIMIYYALSSRGDHETFIFKFGNGVRVFKALKTKENIDLAFEGVENVEVIIG